MVWDVKKLLQQFFTKFYSIFKIFSQINIKDLTIIIYYLQKVSISSKEADEISEIMAVLKWGKHFVSRCLMCPWLLSKICRTLVETVTTFCWIVFPCKSLNVNYHNITVVFSEADWAGSWSVAGCWYHWSVGSTASWAQHC